MLRLVIGRVAWGLLLVVCVSALVFAIFHLLPSGDSAELRAGRGAGEGEVEALRQALGLDQPVLVQFWMFLRDAVLGMDLGQSIHYDVPVTELVGDRLPPTLLLIAGAVLVWLPLGIGLGVAGGARPGSALDRVSGVASITVISAPVFWLGYLALILFSAGASSLLPILPGIGAYGEADSAAGRAAALVLPCLVLGLSSAAVYVRLTRASVTDELARPYVLAARARGIPERRIRWRHAARTGLSPMLTLFGIDVGLILAGNLILIESVFNVPGIGGLLTTAVEQSDLPVIQGVVLVAALTVVLVNVAVDLLYAAVDPRVRPRRQPTA